LKLRWQYGALQSSRFGCLEFAGHSFCLNAGGFWKFGASKAENDGQGLAGYRGYAP
jgi:hypothetical protein